MLNIKCVVLSITLFLSSCAGVVFDPEKVADTFSWNTEEGPSQLPDGVILYECDAKETFYIKYIEDGKSLWITFPKRELKLSQLETNPLHFANGDTLLALEEENIYIKNADDVSYENCKEKKFD